MELRGKMKDDICPHLGSKLPQKYPSFRFCPQQLLTPFTSPLKYEKIKRKSQKHNIITDSYFIKNWGCYLEIENTKSLGILMLNKSVTSEF